MGIIHLVETMVAKECVGLREQKTMADRIRQHTLDNFIEPARKAGKTRVIVRAGDVSRSMELPNRNPAVCSALETKVFLQQARLRLLSPRNQPPSSTTEFRYAFLPRLTDVDSPERPTAVGTGSMRAAWYERKGPAREVLEVGEMPTPEAGPGEVRVRLAASGVNPADVKLRAGTSDYGYRFDRVIPNSDGAGTVDSVGAGVDPAWVGRRVWLYNGQRLGRAFGTAAEYIALDAGLVHALPDELGFAEGATLGIPAMTAHRCVFADGSVAGQTVLVAGGAGAVGHYAVQLAKWGGARVLATVSGEAKAAHAMAGGADAAINYRQEDVVARVRELTSGEGVDRIVEVDFGGNLAIAMGVLKRNGAVAIYASDGNPKPEIDVRALMGLNAALRFVVLNSIPPEARRQAQRDVTRWAAGGEGLFPVAARFPLDGIVAAHELVESLDKLGTVVVEP